MSAGCSPSHSKACASSLGHAPERLRRIERRAQGPVAKHLRRQRAPQVGAIEQSITTLDLRRALESIGGAAWQAVRRPSGRPIPSAAGRRSARLRQGRAASCTSTQSSARRARAASAASALQHRVAARRAARRRDCRRAAGALQCCCQCGSPGASATTDARAARIGDEGRERPLDARCAAQSGANCLGSGIAEAPATAGRRHDEPVAQRRVLGAPPVTARRRVGGLDVAPARARGTTW